MTDHLSLVALTPEDVPAQQAQLVAWCDRAILEVEQDRSDAVDNLRIAINNGWMTNNLTRAEKKAEERLTYLRKIRAASAAGFLIVPNFPVKVMAVRVDRSSPRVGPGRSAAASYEPSAPVLPDVKADLLPVGLGVYVDSEATRTEQRWETENDKGEHLQHVAVTPVGLSAPDFPVVAIKPVVLDATARAMALKIFDRIGIVTGRREDPVVVGQIIDPKRRGSRWGAPKVVSFFIAWWFDTRML